jgi:hypothetical protein
MWPFKKKIKIISPGQAQAEMLKAQTLLFKPKCPIPTCICYSCACRGKCSVEVEVRASGACVIENGPRIVSCSWNKHLKGEFDDAKKKDTTERKPGGVIECSNPNDPIVTNGDFWGFGEIPTV